MEDVNRWYFTKDQLADTPSRKNEINEVKELSYRQQAANFIQDMGQCLHVSQLCINTAIAYMHRFYVFHSFKDINRNSLSMSALFLAAKVEEQPRKLEHVIKVAVACLKKDSPLDVRSEAYAKKAFEVVALENILLQTLGFVLAIEHPHTYVVKVCQLVKASKDLAQTSYLMATTSLHMTTMCLQYKPTIVACVCIHLACKWSSYKIEPCTEGKEWFYYVDRSVTWDLLESLTQEFIAILETSPHRFKQKSGLKADSHFHSSRNIMSECSQDKHPQFEHKIGIARKNLSPSPRPSTSFLSFDICHDFEIKNEPKSPEKTSNQLKPLEMSLSHVSSSAKSQTPPLPTSSTSQPSAAPPQVPPKPVKVESSSISIAAYREKRLMEQLKTKHRPVSNESHAKKPNDRDHHKVHQNVPKPPEPLASLTDTMVASIIKEKSKPLVPKDILHHAQNKLNHQVLKQNTDTLVNKLVPSQKTSVHSARDAVVMLERVEIKKEAEDAKPSFLTLNDELEIPKKLPFSNDLSPIQMDTHAPKIKLEVMRFLKHSKHRTNSLLHNSHESNPQHCSNSLPPAVPQPLLPSHKMTLSKDVKTNGSKEIESAVDKRAVVENNIKPDRKSDVSSKHHERKEKHKSKHSSKEKISNPSSEKIASIKVKIRKDIINLKGVVPEVSQKLPHSESPKPIKIKIPKPLPPLTQQEVCKNASPIKLVITKNKSGSGSYTTSHKESRKRSHDASTLVDGKNSHEITSKYAKLEHAHKGHYSSSNFKQSKVYVQQNASSYHNLDGTSFPYLSPPPPPPKLRGISVGQKTNSNPPLPPPLPSMQPPQPPPPPPE